MSIHLAPDIARAVAARLDRIANHRIAAAPRRFLPSFLADQARGFALEDGTALLDRLLMHKLPSELDALRRAAKLADDAYVVFRKAAHSRPPPVRAHAARSRPICAGAAAPTIS